MNQLPEQKKIFKIKPERGFISHKIDYVSELNPDQLAAVFSDEPRVLVLAGAGSGKTRVITYRVAYLLEKGVRESEIMLATFTNKAAREMLHRVETLLEKPLLGFWGGTFHSLCARILRREATLIGYDRSYTILDREDANEIMSIVRSEQPISYTNKRFPQASLLSDIVSLSKNTRKSIPEVLAWRYSYLLNETELIIKIASEYEARKRELGTMDYDDLLINAVEVFKRFDEIRKRYALHFRHILIDEYQDTNTVQGEFVDLLGSEGAHLFIVGDDSQSIYSFRGAMYSNILEFPQRHENVEIKKLETNYRSTPAILDFANEIFKSAPPHFRKTLKPVKASGEKPFVIPLRDSEEEAMFVATRILELLEEGIKLDQIGVLFRAQSNAIELEIELKKRRIPYRIRGGLRFIEQAHIKDVLAHLILVANPRDEISWKRVLKLQKKVGPRRAQEVWAAISHKPNQLDAFLKTDFYEENGHSPFTDLKNLLRVIRNPSITPSEAIFRISESYYRDYIKDNYTNFQNRLGDIEELGNFAEKFRTITEFLDEISLLGGLAAEDIIAAGEQEETLILSTIHQAKGLEWNIVFLIRCHEGNMPSALAVRDGYMDEERRVFYVAVTRAKDELYITYPQLVSRKGSMPVIKRVSPFIKEIDPSKYIEATVQYDTSSKEETETGSGDELESIMSDLLTEDNIDKNFLN